MGTSLVGIPNEFYKICDGTSHEVVPVRVNDYLRKLKPGGGGGMRLLNEGETPDFVYIHGLGWRGIFGTAGCDGTAAPLAPLPAIVIDGPRSGDLSVASSSYGVPRPIAYGTVPIKGEIIWSRGIDETNARSYRRDNVDGQLQTTIETNYFYSASVAFAFGEGPCQDVLRIWANGQVIFDKRDISNTTRMAGLKFKLHRGTTTQLPDSVIVAKELIDYTPAFRGTVYIVFEDFPLADFNNRIPKIEAEISYDTTLVRPQEISGSSIHTSLNSYSAEFLGVDWARGYAYYVSANAAPNNGISRVNLNTLLKDKEVFNTDAFIQNTGQGTTKFSNLGGLGVMPDGSILASVGIALPFSSNSAPLVLLDGTTLKEIARFGTGGTGLGMEATRFSWVQVIVPITVATETGRKIYAICGSTLFNGVGVLSIPDLAYVWDSDTAITGGLPTSKLLAIVPGAQGEAWVLAGPDYTASSPDDVLLYKLTVGSSGQVSFNLFKTLTVADLLPSDTAANQVGPMAYDTANNRLMIFCSGATSAQRTIVIFDIFGKTVVARTPDIGITPSNSNWEASVIENDTFSFIVGNNGVFINTVDSTISINEAPNFAEAETGGGAGVYDSKSESFIGLYEGAGGGPMIRFYFNRNPGNGEPLSVVQADIAARVGLDATYVDFTDIANIDVSGFVIDGTTSARRAMDALNGLYLVDMFESDFKIKAKKRGDAVVRSFTENDLAIIDTRTGQVVQEVRAQEIEMPEDFTVEYMDRTNDYAQSAHSSKRVTEPDPSMYSDNKMSISMGPKNKLRVSLHPDTAKRQSEKMMYSIWAGRSQYGLNLSWEHLDLDPADVIELTLDNGVRYRPRVIELDIGADLTLNLKGKSEELTQYISTATADPGSVGKQPVTGSSAVQTFLLDMPLLNDAHEQTGRTANPLYFFMGGYSENAFRRGALYGTDDGINFSVLGEEDTGMSWGIVINTLADPMNGNPFITDTTSTINISMNVGGATLESTNQAGLVSDENVALIVKSNGEIEVINYRDVNVVGENSYELTTLLRGRRGTDTMAFGHGQGELIIFVQGDAGERFLSSLTNKDAPKDYKAVGGAQLFDRGQDINLTSKHRALKPYFPANSTAAVDVSNDINFIWERRTRLSGEWKQATTQVPLNEDTEEYEIDIYSGPGAGAVIIRTITGISTNSYKYLNADIIADFGSIPGLLSYELFQISAQVGRGFSKRRTVGLPDIEVDPHFSSVVLLLSFDGVNAATTTIDDSDSSHTVTMSNGAKLDTSQSKFGPSSYICDGVDDIVYIADHADFDLNTQEFTFELSVRWNTIQDSFNALLSQWYSEISARNWQFTWDTTGLLQFYTSPNGISQVVTGGSWTPSLNTWYQLAIDRDASNVIRVYVDGVVVASATDATDITAVGSPQIAVGHRQGTRQLDGWIDEVRMTVGVARYAGAYTPRNIAFPRPI